LSETTYLTDNELMQNISNYDSKSLEELYDRYSPLLFTLIKKIIGGKEKAEEILSDIFVILWRKNDRFVYSSNNIYTWLVTLARNKAVDVLKRRDNADSIADYTDEYEDEFIIPVLPREIEKLDLETVLGMGNTVMESYNNLTDAQRYVIDLALYEGLDEKKIAGKLNIPLPTVKSKLQLALGILHQNLLNRNNGQ